jgi:hypothetical protein
MQGARCGHIICGKCCVELEIANCGTPSFPCPLCNKLTEFKKDFLAERMQYSSIRGLVQPENYHDQDTDIKYLCLTIGEKKCPVIAPAEPKSLLLSDTEMHQAKKNLIEYLAALLRFRTGSQ